MDLIIWGDDRIVVKGWCWFLKADQLRSTGLKCDCVCIRDSPAALSLCSWVCCRAPLRAGRQARVQNINVQIQYLTVVIYFWFVLIFSHIFTVQLLSVLTPALWTPLSSLTPVTPLSPLALTLSPDPSHKSAPMAFGRRQLLDSSEDELIIHVLSHLCKSVYSAQSSSSAWRTKIRAKSQTRPAAGLCQTMF